MQDFRKLRVWQAARQLTTAVYKATKRWPQDERFGLSAQVRSSVVSIGANIAEGFGRGTRAETARFLQIAIASSSETLHHLITALDLDYLTEAEFDELEGLHGPVRRMLTNLFFRVKPKKGKRAIRAVGAAEHDNPGREAARPSTVLRV